MTADEEPNSAGLRDTEQAVERARRSATPVQARHLVTEDGFETAVGLERIGIGPLLTQFGKFEMYAFQVSDKWIKYSVLVMAPEFVDFKPRFEASIPLIVRFDSGCETGQMFGDQTCECREQLELGLEQIADNGQGVLINIPHQDGRGMGLPFKLATLRLQDELGVDTVESSELFEPIGTRDSRTYAGAIAILKFLGVQGGAVRLSTNNPKKRAIFVENGYEVERLPNVIPPTEHTKRHLSAKQARLAHEDLYYEGGLEERGFIEKLRATAAKNDSRLCCGLDPILSLMPMEVRGARSDDMAVTRFVRGVIDSTYKCVCSYKIQKAFFDVLPQGDRSLKRVIDYIRSLDADIPIILDAKTGDISNTMEAYLQKFFSVFRVDALVINPYMGDDVFAPFARYPGRAGIVLCRTSNSSGAGIQDQPMGDGRPLWRLVYDMVETRWRAGEQFIPILAARATDEYAGIGASDRTMPIFLAGFGTQGGRLEMLPALAAGDRPVLVNSSRAILYGPEDDGPDWCDAVRKRAVASRDAINAAARSVA